MYSGLKLIHTTQLKTSALPVVEVRSRVKGGVDKRSNAAPQTAEVGRHQWFLQALLTHPIKVKAEERREENYKAKA